MKTSNKFIIAGIMLTMMLVSAYVGIKPGVATAITSGSILINYDTDGQGDPDCVGFPADGSCVAWGDGHDNGGGGNAAQLNFCLDSAVKYTSGLSDISGLQITSVQVAKHAKGCLTGDPDNTYRTYAVSFSPKCTANTAKQCVGNSVYNFDSCGTQGSLFQQCTASQVCQNAQCAAVACSSNSQCGTSGFTGDPFCQGNSVYKNYTTYTCNSPGTPSSYCTNSTTAQLQTACTSNQICSSGTCINQNIACSTNSQCGTNGFTGGPFCQGNSVYKNFITYTCNNPGTSSSSCTNAAAAQLQTTCTSNQTCTSGSCINQNIACSTNSQCGTNGFTGGPFCQGNSVYKNYRTYTCNNPGTSSSSCTNATAAQLQTTCTSNQTCANGSCSAVACTTNSQCGTNGLTGGLFCQGNNVYQNYINYTCNNPGTSSSLCSNSTAPQLQTTCTSNQICSSGTCINQNIACSTNSQCGTSGFTGGPFCQGNSVYKNYRTYTCNNPGTASSSCTNATVAQLQSACTSGHICSNGSCSTVACSANSDCGTSGLTGGPFCQGNSVYKNFITYTCNNPGTSSSSCTNATAAQLQTTCTGNQTCSSGNCVNQNIACTTSSDCGTNGPTGGLFCQGNNVYQNYINYTCNNPGTSSSLCSNSTAAQLQTTCTGNQICSNGSCTNNCTQNFQQRCNGNTLYWYDSCGTLGNPIQTCPNGCVNNACVNQVAGTLTLSKTVRNLTNGAGFSSSTFANPSDMLMFMITLRAVSQDVQNVVVRDVLPTNLIYNDQLVVACTGTSGNSNNCNTNNYNYSGNITAGIGLNTIYAGQTVTISYQAQVASVQNFSFGTTTLNNSASVVGSATGYVPPAIASVVVTRSAVLGATTVSTGLTNNFWLDSFILPLILTLMGLWMWRSGMLFGIEKWLDNKKKVRRTYRAQRELSSRVADIQRMEG